MFAEVIFPLKVKTFTYKIPPEAPFDLTGRIVRATLINRELYGIVSDVMESIPYTPPKIKEILSIHEHLGSPSIIALIKWLGSYYLNPAGAALTSCFLKEAVSAGIKPVDRKKKPSKKTVTFNLEEANRILPVLSEGMGENISLLADAINKACFKTFLLHSPSSLYERGFLSEILKNTQDSISGAIILTPEIGMIDKTASLLRLILGGRVCSLHSKQSRREKIETIKGILSGSFDIVVGTRSAIFAPLKKISFIAVTGEHSPSYKAEEGLRYNARDVAVMRGLLEKAPVLLSSICPSIESIYNARTGKFSLLKISGSKSASPPYGFSLFSAKNRPAIGIVGAAASDKKGCSITDEILSAAKIQLSKKEHILFIVSTKGYSLILCSDCGYIFRCPACNTPLKFYKNEGLLKCHLCGRFRGAPDTCERCGGIELKAYGAGDERIIDDIEKSFGRKALILNKNNLFQNAADCQLKPFVIGHRGQAKKLMENSFSLAVFFDADLALSEAAFSSNERVFQGVMEISQLIKPGGQIIIPTRHPKNKILNFIKNYDFRGFYKNELILRKETDFPPFSRLILFNIFSRQKSEDLIKDIKTACSEKIEEGVQIYGPVEVASPVRSYKYCLQYLLKSRDRKRLNLFASSLKDRLSLVKGIKISTDVDPVRL